MTGDNRDAREAQSPGFPSPEMISRKGRSMKATKLGIYGYYWETHIHLSPLFTLYIYMRLSEIFCLYSNDDNNHNDDNDVYMYICIYVIICIYMYMSMYICMYICATYATAYVNPWDAPFPSSDGQ